MGLGVDIRNKMAKRAAQELHNGMVVNLGIGIPSLVPNHLPDNHTIMFHAENGILGIGPSPEKGLEDENLCNAAGYPVTVIKGASYFDSTVAFGMIRRGKIDVTILGALEVSERGDLANWIVPGKKVPGIGGAMDLAMKAKKVVVLMSHLDKYGRSKLVKECSLPLTAKRCVDLVITDMGVFKIADQQLILTDIFYPYTINDIKKHTLASFTVEEPIRMIKE
jgi:acetate CoA/acetoacetate CoA-transferase beta subunit